MVARRWSQELFAFLKCSLVSFVPFVSFVVKVFVVLRKDSEVFLRVPLCTSVI